MQSLLASLTRKDQRAVDSLVRQHGIGADEVEAHARSWIAAIEATCRQVSLLVTNDLVALGRILGLQEGLGFEWVARGELLPLVPGIDQMVEFFLSDRFEETQLSMQIPDA